jgi:PAS domain S-box-containing protein
MHIIGLLMGHPADRRLVSDFLRGSGHVVQAGVPSDLDLLDLTGLGMVIADTASARQHLAMLTALRRQTPDIVLPLLIALPPKEPGLVWLQAGFDDVLRLPLAESEFAARVDALLRLRDLTAAQFRERTTLAISEARFRSVFERTAASMVITDPAGRLVKVNAALCRFLDYGARELTNRTVSAITHPDDRAETARLFDEVLSGQRSAFDLEKRYVRKDGSTVRGRTAAVFQFDTRQQPLYGIAIILVITARKLAEAERDLLNED